MGHFRRLATRFLIPSGHFLTRSASLLGRSASRVAAAMSSRQYVRLRTEDMIRCPRVVWSWAFAADVTVSCGLPHQPSTLGVVTLVVRSRGVAYRLTLAGADVAACGVGGESAALDAWSTNGHQTHFSCSLIAFAPLMVQLQSQHDATVFA